MHGCFIIIPLLSCIEICVVLPKARKDMRETFNIDTGFCPNDCLTSLCCAFCAIVQLKTELKKRGLYGESAVMKYKQQQKRAELTPPATEQMQK